jgi:hypothetical protein
MEASSLLYKRIIISLVYLNFDYRGNERVSFLNPDGIVLFDQGRRWGAGTGAAAPGGGAQEAAE